MSLYQHNLANIDRFYHHNDVFDAGRKAFTFSKSLVKLYQIINFDAFE